MPEEILETSEYTIRWEGLEVIQYLAEHGDNWKDLSQQQISQLTYELLSSNFKYEDADIAAVLQKLMIEHPNANQSTEKLVDLLVTVAGNSNLDAFNMLKEKHPKWDSIPSKDLLKIAQATIFQVVSYDPFEPLSAQQIEKQKRNEQILAKVLEHNHWDKDCPKLTKKFASWLVGSAFHGISPDVKLQYFKEIQTYPAWEKLDETMVTDIFCYAVRWFDSQNNENLEYVIDRLSCHKSWQSIGHYNLKRALYQLSRAHIRREDAESGWIKTKLVRMFMKHPGWNELTTRDLCQLVIDGHHSSDYHFEFVYYLSQQPNWKNISPFELEAMMYHYTGGDEMLLLFTRHPSWQAMSKEAVVNLAEHGAWRSDIGMIWSIRGHKTWEDFTEQDLLEIVKGFKWSARYGRWDELKQVLSMHDKWDLVSERAEKMINKSS